MLLLVLLACAGAFRVTLGPRGAKPAGPPLAPRSLYAAPVGAKPDGTQPACVVLCFLFRVVFSSIVFSSFFSLFSSSILFLLSSSLLLFSFFSLRRLLLSFPSLLFSLLFSLLLLLSFSCSSAGPHAGKPNGGRVARALELLEVRRTRLMHRKAKRVASPSYTDNLPDLDPENRRLAAQRRRLMQRAQERRRAMGQEL